MAAPYRLPRRISGAGAFTLLSKVQRAIDVPRRQRVSLGPMSKTGRKLDAMNGNQTGDTTQKCAARAVMAHCSPPSWFEGFGHLSSGPPTDCKRPNRRHIPKATQDCRVSIARARYATRPSHRGHARRSSCPRLRLSSRRGFCCQSASVSLLC